MIPPKESLERRAWEKEIFEKLTQQANRLPKPELEIRCGIFAEWYGNWKNYVEDKNVKRPGPINNSVLHNEYGSVATEKIDEIVFISEEAWKALVHWYTSDADFVHISDVDKAGTRTKRVKSRSTSIYEDFDIPTPPLHWNHTWIETGDGINMSSERVCEVCRNPARYYCKNCHTALYCGKDQECQKSDWKYHSQSCQKMAQYNIPQQAGERQNSQLHLYPDQTRRRGHCGLKNLGNTCYMNATIQCLAHCWPLTRYFLSNAYKKDRNLHSKLGTGGRFASVWSSILRDMWLGTNSVLNPTAMKRAIGTLPGSGNQFRGYQQHDAQELLVFLLDTLHEDLNLVHQKPYFSCDDKPSRTTPIPKLAAESWMHHRKRECSMVTNIFEGQLHNSVECPRCSHCSNTFSPFMFLTLALPVDLEDVVPVTVVHAQQQGGKSRSPKYIRKRYAIPVYKDSNMIEFKKHIHMLAGIPPNQQWLGRINKSGNMFPFSNGARGVHQLLRNQYQIVCFQVDAAMAESTHCEVIVLHRARKNCGTESEPHQGPEEDSGNEDTNKKNQLDLFGVPMAFRFDPSETTFLNLRKKIVDMSTLFLNDLKPSEERDLVRNLPIYFCDSKGVVATESMSEDNEDEELDEHQESGDMLFANGSHAIVDNQTPPISGGDVFFLVVDWPKIENTWKANTQTRATVDWQDTIDSGREDHVSVSKLEERQQRKYSGRDSHDTHSLRECLDYFSNKEQLAHGNMWNCPNCHSDEQAFKRMNIIRLPEILVLSLKRFDQRESILRNKLTSLVDFPLEGLDMASYLAEYGGDLEKQDTLFDLFAVTNHHGTMGFGHYTAFVARQYDLRGPVVWFEYDDGNVNQISASDVVTSSAYVLYYRRRRTTDTSMRY